ncbi:uncharacterized protein M6B38_356615 [Iris pallida]|uniref:Uncharacterized protein n=1 Tax=Iris pallida TaxID=29817 RepID=A0AAX6GLK8_IRIPA|nr:uncharacterized protein M6B38_356615 [Iris pallida]
MEEEHQDGHHSQFDGSSQSGRKVVESTSSSNGSRQLLQDLPYSPLMRRPYFEMPQGSSSPLMRRTPSISSRGRPSSVACTAMVSLMRPRARASSITCWH